MKVLNISETTKGGIETFFGSLSRARDLDHDFLSIGYTNSIIPLKDKNSRLKNLITLLYLSMFKVKLNDYDVIFLHSTFSGVLRFFIYPISKLMKFKVVYCSHGWAFDIDESNKRGIKKKFYIFIERLLTHFCDTVFCISQSDLNSAKSAGLSDKKLVLNWNGVRESVIKHGQQVTTNKSSKVKVLFVGRLDRQKGLFEFFSSIKTIAKDLNKKVEFTIIGEPVRNDCPELLELLNTPIPNTNITCIGWVENANLDYYYHQTDFVIVPSLWEGFGLIVAEALRNGKPVFASDVGSLPYMLNSRTGWLFESNNRLSLEGKFKEVINNELYKAITPTDCLSDFNTRFHERIMNINYFIQFGRLYE